MSDLIQFRNYCWKMAKVRGVQSHADRALWAMLAAEVDAYMAGDPDVIRVPEPDDVALEGM